MEKICERCNGHNPVWFTDNELWNKHCADYIFLCPICFIEIAEANGEKVTGWELLPEKIL